MAKKRKTSPANGAHTQCAEVEEIIINNPESNTDTEANIEIKPEVKPEVKPANAAREACAATPLVSAHDSASEPKIKHEPKPYKRPLRRL